MRQEYERITAELMKINGSVSFGLSRIIFEMFSLSRSRDHIFVEIYKYDPSEFQYQNQFKISEGEGVTQNTTAPQFLEVFELSKTGSWKDELVVLVNRFDR